MVKNETVTKTVHVTNMGEKQEEEQEKSYEARIYPNIFDIKQGFFSNIYVEYYINDEISIPQNIKIEIDRNNVPKKNFVFTTSDNTFTITNKLKYFDSPLKINVNVDDILLNQEYWLVGAL